MENGGNKNYFMSVFCFSLRLKKKKPLSTFCCLDVYILNENKNNHYKWFKFLNFKLRILVELLI